VKARRRKIPQTSASKVPAPSPNAAGQSLKINPTSHAEAMDMMMPAIKGMVYDHTVDREPYSKNEAMREDLIDVCLHAVIRIYDDWALGRINIKNSFYSYCRKALGREIEDAIKEDRRVLLADPGDVEKTPDELDVAAIASLNLDKARLEKAIQQLPVVERRYADDLIDRDEKPRDMAKHLGVPVRDVYMLQKSVVRRLRRLLSRISVRP